MASIVHAAPSWPLTAPEQLPPLTVRWEDPAQQQVFIVEGARYQCRVATQPARVLSLIVDGKNLLGPQGLQFAIEDASGTRLEVAPPDIVPGWQVWRGQNWAPANNSRARMNVWSAGPHYWDAHLLDIPFMSADDVSKTRGAASGPTLQTFDFAQDNGAWTALNNSEVLRAPDGAMRIQITGDDPYIQSPPLDLPGPLTLALRMRQKHGGSGVFYWDSGNGYAGAKNVMFPSTGDGEWHDYLVTINEPGHIRRLRFDPPGESGEVDIQSLRIYKADTAAKPQPARGEMVFHAFQDKLHIEFRVKGADGKAAPRTAILTWDGVPQIAPVTGRALATLGQGNARAAVLGGPQVAPNAKIWRAPLQNGSAFFVVKPLAENQTAQTALHGELQPLGKNAVRINGGQWLGYNAASGLYDARFDADKSAFGFEATFRNPSRRMEMSMEAQNDGAPRDILIKAQTGIGNLEAGVIADKNGFPLPQFAWVAKNFAGEREEPDDSAFGDIYVPLRLNANEKREFQVFGLFQNWGDAPLKQVSSIRFFHIYWHLSTGASETTCFTHNWMPTGPHIFHIPDFRPLSGPFWAGQPQHDCQQWPGFLQYNDGKGKLVYDRTIFESISPKLARFAMLFHTADDSATARVDVMEIPQRDEMRTFLKLRYDWTRPVVIEGDARRNFRWLNMAEKHLVSQLLWTAPDGKLQIRPVEKSNTPLVLGEPLTTEFPLVGSNGRGENYSSLVQIRSIKGRLGGQPFAQAALSAQYAGNNSATNAYWLTVPQEKLTLQPGDFLEAELYLMPHGEPSPPDVKPNRERRNYGLNGPKITVTQGEKLGDFPARVKVQNDAAQFSLEGGDGEMPLIIEGFSGAQPGVPLLWQNGVWQNQQAHGGDYYQVEPDGQGGLRFILVTPHREGQKHEFVVTRALGNFKSLRDRNGRLEIEADGAFSLQAPVVFGPGKNTVKGMLFSFSGTARATQLPIGFTSVQPVELSVNQWSPERMMLQIGGAATVTVGDLINGTRYRVKIGDSAREMLVEGGQLKIETKGAVAIEIAPAG